MNPLPASARAALQLKTGPGYCIMLYKVCKSATVKARSGKDIDPRRIGLDNPVAVVSSVYQGH